MRTIVPTLLTAVLGLVSVTPGAMGQTTGLDGVWVPTDYVMADGVRHPVDGRIFFAGTDWTVLFFVTEDGQPRRGSAEGGTFEAAGDSLVFTHLYHLSAGEAMAGLAERPLRMEVSKAGDASLEACRFAIEGDRLTIVFPSGNRMAFSRSFEP